MAEGKEIKFKFVVDEASARQVNKVLDDMIKRAQELGKTLAGVGGVGGGGLLGGGLVGGKIGSPQSSMVRAAGSQTQKVSFAGVLSQNTDAFKKLADQGGASMRAMSDAIARGISQQQREIFKLQDSLQALTRTYDKLGDSAGGALGEKLQTKMIQIQRRIDSHKDQMGKLQEMEPGVRGGRPELMPEVPWPDQAGGPKPGFLSRMGGILNTKIGMPSGFGGAAAIAALVIAGADAALGESRAGTRAFQSAEAERGRMMEGRIRSMMGGDTKFLMNLAAIRQDSAARKDLESQTKGFGAKAETIADSIKGSVGAIPIIGAVAQKLGIVPEGGGQGGGMMLGAWTTSAQQGKQMEHVLNQIDEQGQKTAMLFINMAQEQFQSGLGSRIRAQRALGIAGLGQRYTVRPGVTDTDQYSRIQRQVERQGFGMDEFVGAVTGLRATTGGDFANRYATMALGAQVQGYGAFMGVAGGAARAGYGSAAFQAIGGGIAKGAGIQLGEALVGSGFDVTGVTDQTGAINAAIVGMGMRGNIGDFNKVQQAVAGLQFGNQITQGGISPYMRGRNLVSAIQNAPGATTYAQDYLANGLTMQQMINLSRPGGFTGNVADYLQSMNINQNQVQKQLGSSMTGFFDFFKDQKGNDPMTQSIRKFRESHMDLLDYANAERNQKGGQGELRNLAFGLTSASGGKIPLEAALGILGVASGTDADLVKKGGIGGGIRKGSVEDAALEAQQKNNQNIDITLRTIADQLKKSYEQLPTAIKSSVGFGSNLSTEADAAADALGRLADYINKLPGIAPPGGQKKPANTQVGAPKPEKK